MPDDWRPNDDLAAWTLAQGLNRDDARRELEKFRDYWRAASGAKGVKRDWDATWRNWIRKAADDRRRALLRPVRSVPDPNATVGYRHGPDDPTETTYTFMTADEWMREAK